MTKEHKKAIKIIEKFSPKDFGVRNVYYKTTPRSLEVLFIIKKTSTPSLINYLNSLSSVISNEVDNLKINSSVYYYESKDKINKVTNDENLIEMNVSNFSNVSI